MHGLQTTLKLAKLEPDVIRGTASEIMALAGAVGIACEADSIAELGEVVAIAKQLAVDLDTCVAISGREDYVRLSACFPGKLDQETKVVLPVQTATNMAVLCGVLSRISFKTGVQTVRCPTQVTDGLYVLKVTHGHPMLQRIPGAGCAVSALIALVMTANDSAVLLAIAFAMGLLGAHSTSGIPSYDRI